MLTNFRHRRLFAGAAVLFAAAATSVASAQVIAEVDVASGDVSITSDVALTAIDITSPAAGLLPDNFVSPDGFSSLSLTDVNISSVSLTDTLSFDGSLSLGAIYNVELDPRDLSFVFGDEAANPIIIAPGEVIYTNVPEPTSAAVLLLAGGALVRRRSA